MKDGSILKQKKIAVLFGGVSPEHDVSILTGVQACYALDQAQFEPYPVYIDVKGQWWAGEGLLAAHKELVNGCFKKDIKPVVMCHQGFLVEGQKRLPVDACLIALHGGAGENGSVQGLCELYDMPYTGLRHDGAAVAMNKWLTKKILAQLGVAVLPEHRLTRLQSGEFYTRAMIEAMQLTFPVCVKPCSLGSSVGIGFANDVAEVQAQLLTLFDYDDAVLIEPAVANLKEFNVSVRKDSQGEVQVSAIESPKVEHWLDFNEKYCSGGQSKKQSMHGLIHLSRDINPSMPEGMKDQLVRDAKIAFDALGGAGAPRIDFLADMKEGRIWLNEVNTTPGSFGFYLWAAQNQAQGFIWLLNALLDEAFNIHALKVNKSQDPVPVEARLFTRVLA